MAQMNFGEMLQEARERKGIDLHSAARSLRIRPDILQAIEMADFSRLPHPGLARNMVNAYARMLGLNPAEITRLYLEQAYADEITHAREERPRASSAGAARSSQRGRSQAERSGGASRSSQPGRSVRTGRAGRTERAQRTAEPDYRSDYSQGFRRPLYTDARPDAYRTSSVAQQRLHPERETHSSRRSAMPRNQYTNFYAGPSAPKRVGGYLPYIIAGVVILVLLIVLVTQVFGGKGSAEDDTPKIPVTGLTDPEGAGSADDSSADEAEAAVKMPVAPTAAVFKYEVAKGEDAYIEVYLDDGGASVAQTVSGPDSKSFDVTGTLKFVTTNPAAVTATVDGEVVEPVDENKVGVYTYVVDFPAILEKWQEDNAAAIAAAEAANKAKAASSEGSGTSDGSSGTDAKKTTS